MKKYIIPLLIVLLLSVSCKKPEMPKNNIQVTLSVVSTGENNAHLKVESNTNDFAECCIIDKKTNKILGEYESNQWARSMEMDLYSLQPHTTYKVFGIVYGPYFGIVGYMTNEVTFKTE